MTRSLSTEAVQRRVSLRGNIAGCNEERGHEDGRSGSNRERVPGWGVDDRIGRIDQPRHKHTILLGWNRSPNGMAIASENRIATTNGDFR